MFSSVVSPTFIRDATRLGDVGAIACHGGLTWSVTTKVHVCISMVVRVCTYGDHKFITSVIRLEGHLYVHF